MSLVGRTCAAQLTCLPRPVLSMQAGLVAVRPQQGRLLGWPMQFRDLVAKRGVR